MHILHSPTANEVLKHCLFWDEDKQCNFFEAVNLDRLDKTVKIKLENGGADIIHGDWEWYRLPTSKKESGTFSIHTRQFNGLSAIKDQLNSI